MKSSATIRQERPLSPHLQVYKPQITSMMSIMHRFTGVVLYAGSVLLVLWLWGAAYSPALFECLHEAAGAWYGRLMLIGWSMAFFYHLANGIRHLLWDAGKGLEVDQAERSGVFVLMFVMIFTFALWFYLLGGNA